MAFVEIGALVALAVMVILAAFDVFWPFTVALVLAAVAAWWLGHSGVLLALLKPSFAIGYVVVGFAWVFFKWTRLVDQKLRESRTERYPKPPKWSEHSYDFAAYFFYWPADMVAYVLSDLIRDVWRYLSAMVARSFDRYAEWRFKSVASK